MAAATDCGGNEGRRPKESGEGQMHAHGDDPEASEEEVREDEDAKKTKEPKRNAKPWLTHRCRAWRRPRGPACAGAGGDQQRIRPAREAGDDSARMGRWPRRRRDANALETADRRAGAAARMGGSAAITGGASNDKEGARRRGQQGRRV